MKTTNLFRAGVAALTITTLVGVSQAKAETAQLVESGSSLLYPLFNLWVPAYTANHKDVAITTTSTGSGAGIAQAIKGLINIGASDAYLSDALAKDHPNVLSIPLAISSQAINYNLPGVKDLKLSGPVLASIYEGKITKWNDPAIASENPGVKLPDHEIIPIHRLDGSGDTFLFSQYLAASDENWSNTYHYSTSISWPAVSGALGAKGNSGMLAALKANPYAVAYIGISYADAVAKDGLGQAALRNKAGKYVLPTASSISAAAESVAEKTPADERISMIFTPGAEAYPIVNYEYAIVNAEQPNKETAKVVRDFLSWALTEGNNESFLKQVQFVKLPANVVALSKAQIEKIK